MPLFTDEEKRKLVQLEGLNPDQFDYDESTASFVKRQTVQPTVTTTTVSPISKQQQNVTSAAGAAGANFAAGILPTAGGLAGAAGAGALAAKLTAGPSVAAAPATGGLSLLVPLLAGAAGAMGGSWLTAKAQQKAIEEVAPEANRYLEAAQAEHPLASTAGNIAAALPMLRVDPRVLKEAGGAISKVVSKGPGVSLNPVDINALANVGMGAGLGAGASAIDIAQSGRDVESRDLLNVLGNVLINNPRPYLKSRLGLPFDTNEEIREMVEPATRFQQQDAVNYQLPPEVLAARAEAQVLPARQVKEETPIGTAKDIAEYEREVTRALSKTVSAEREILAERKKQLKFEAELRAAEKESAELAEAAKTAVAEIPAEQRVMRSKANEVIPFEGRTLEPLMTERQAPPVEIPFDDPARITTKPVSKNIPLTVKPGLEVERPLPKVDFTQEAIKRQQEEIEMRRLASEPKSEAEMAEERLTGQKQRFSQESELANVPNEIRAALDAQYGKDNWGVTESAREMNELLAKSRKIAIKYDSTQKQSGAYQDGVARINPEREGIDTAPHEVTHGFFDFLHNSKSKIDRDLVSRGHQIAEQSPEYQKWRVSQSPEKLAALDASSYQAGDKSFSGAVHEFLTEHTAYGYLKTERKISGEKSAWEQWKNDFMSHLRYRFGKGATLQDHIRLLANRLRYDAPMTYEGGRVMTTAREQDLSNLKGELYLPPAYDDTLSLSKNVDNLIAYKEAYEKANPGKETTFEFGQKPFTSEKDLEGKRYRADARYSKESRLEGASSPIGPSKRMMDDEAFFAKYPSLKNTLSPYWSTKVLKEYTGFGESRIKELRQQGIDVVEYARGRTKTAPQVDAEGRAIRNEQGEIQYRERPQRAKIDLENPIMQDAVKRGVYMALRRLPSFVKNVEASEAIRNRIYTDNLITGEPYVRGDLRKEITQSVMAGLQKEGIQSNKPMEQAVFEDASKMASREFNKMYQKVASEVATGEQRASAELTPQEKALLEKRQATEISSQAVAKAAPKDSIPVLVDKWEEMVEAFKNGYAEPKHMFMAVEKLKPRLEAAGMKPADIQDLLLGTMEELGLIGSSVGEAEGRILGSQFDDEEARFSDTSKLITQTEKELRQAKPFGLQVNNDGTVNKDAIGAAIKKLNPLEQDLLKSAGWDDYFNGVKGNKVKAQELADWLAANGPKVEVLSYGMEGKVSEAKREYDALTHKIDSMGGEYAGFVDSLGFRLEHADSFDRAFELTKKDWTGRVPLLTSQDKKELLRYFELKKIVDAEPRDTSPRATSYYDSISAFDTKEPMPEWTTSKEGRNVQRVDVVIPKAKPIDAKGYVGRPHGGNYYIEDGKFHEPSKWVPDNLHENVPNTLGWAMIQYKTGPKGEKIALIAEAQSQWAQKRRANEPVKVTLEENGKRYKIEHRDTDVNPSYVDVEGYGRGKWTAEEALKVEHDNWKRTYDTTPLLRDYNRLILKAAIDQARKEGATHVVVSDAETAMMTERLDQQARPAYKVSDIGKYGLKSRYNEYRRDTNTDELLSFDSKAEAEKQAEWISKWYGEDLSEPVLITEEMTKPVIKQEPGFRFNYDTILPKIAEELTGDEGTRISLGEHKNAVRYTPESLDEKRYFSKEEALEAARIQKEIHTPDADVTLKEFDTDTEEPYWRLQVSSYSVPRSDLIFTNPDGTPKTDVTGMMFDISVPAARRASGEPMTMSGKRYQGESKLTIDEKLAQRFTEDFIVKRNYFGKISNNPAAMVNKDAIGIYHTWEKRGYTAEPDATRTATHEAFHAFWDEYRMDIYHSLVSKLKAKAIPADEILRLRNAIPESYKELRKRLLEAHFSVEQWPDVINDKYHEGGVLSYGQIATAISDGVNEILARRVARKNDPDYLQHFADTFIGPNFRNALEQAYSGNVAENNFAKYNKDTKVYYSDISKLNPARLLQPELDSLKDAITPKLAEKVVPAFSQAARTKNSLYGQFGNRALKTVQDTVLRSPKDKLLGSNESTKKILNALYYERDNEAPASHIALTAAERNVIKELRDTFKAQHDWQRKEGPLVAAIDADGKVTYREPITNPYYVPHMTDSSVVEVLMRSPDSAEANKLREVFRKYRADLGQSPEEIDKSLRRFQPNKVGGAKIPDFNAVRIEEGLGLPPEWREKDLTRLLRRYNDRWSTDMAFYKHIQSDPVLRRVMDIKDDGRGNSGEAVMANTLDDGTDIKDVNLNSMPQVQTIMREWNRSYPVTDVKVNAVNRAIKSFMMQTVTGLSDVVTALPTAMKLVRPSEAHLIPAAIANIRKGYATGLKNGTIRLGASAYEDIRGLGMETGWTKFLEGVAATTNKVFGREALEEVSRSLTNALGGLLGETRLAGAKGGNTKDIKWLNELGLNVDWKTAPSAEVIDAIAARVTELNQGTYDYQDLPRWAIEGSVAPFVSLAKWNISQFNNFNKTVIKELKDGNPTPLLMATVGALIGGAAVEELRQMINKRKPNQLTNAEYFATGEDTAYKLASLASLSGFAGIATEMAKTAMDIERGNRPQGFTFPFAEVLANTTDRVAQFSQALDAGTKFEEAFLPFVQNIISDHIQMARVGMRQIEPEEETIRAGAQRERRLFKQVVQGESVPLSARSNPMMRPSEKEFKRTESIEDAARMLPILLEDAMKRSGGDYEKMKQEFQRLKSNSVQTFPSPELWPIEFAAQVQWLSRTKGEKAAQEAVTKFLRQREINKAKAKMVPTLK